MTAALGVRSIRYYAYKAGFRGQAQTTVTAIALAESGGNPHARNTNTDASIDRGLLQINGKWHPEVSDAAADDPASAMMAGFRISTQGTNFSPWSTFTSGAYKTHLAAAAGQPHPNPPPASTTMRTRLVHPFAGAVSITQPFGPTGVASEPLGYYLADLAVTYDQGAGSAAQHVHCGVDYALTLGTPLTAPAGGIVALAGWSPTGFGNRTVIDHGDVLTLYGHQSAIGVAPGQAVSAGEVIGHVGSTGNSTGAHLHFSCLDGPMWREFGREVWLDPARYIDGW